MWKRLGEPGRFFNPLCLRRPIKAELISPFSGFIQLSFSIPPSLRATSPIAHTCAKEEVNAFLLNCLCFLLLFRFYVRFLEYYGTRLGRRDKKTQRYLHCPVIILQKTAGDEVPVFSYKCGVSVSKAGIGKQSVFAQIDE